MEAYPFFLGQENGRRMLDGELRDYFLRQYGCLLVDGLARVTEAGGALAGTERVAGNMETPVFAEWKLPLGGEPLALESAPVPDRPAKQVGFLFSCGFGMGSPLPQPTGVFELRVNGHLAAVVRRVNHSQDWRQEPGRFLFAMSRCETAAPYGSLTLSSTITGEGQAAFGLGLLLVPAAWCQPGAPARIEVRGQSRVASASWIYFAASPMAVQGGNLGTLLEMMPGKPPRSGDYRVYFGDIHTHSGQNKGLAVTPESGCGIGSWEENYEFARGPGGLDFFALTDHEWQVEPGMEQAYFSLADAYNRDGRFACLYAYEHTSLLYGHRNVYFREAPLLVNNNRTPGGGPTLDPALGRTPQELFALLAGRECFTVPHHPSAASHPFTFAHFNPQFDKLVEIYSCWGSSDFEGDFPRGVSERHRGLYVREALRRGYRFGLTASADGHDGCAGAANGPQSKHHHQYHFLGSGRAAVLCEELDRGSVYDALKARRCYATTGTPMVLDFSLNGSVMGSELPAFRGAPRLDVRVRGTNGLDYLEVVRNGRPLLTVPCHGAWEYELSYTDQGYDGGPASYFVKAVQVDREAAWTSPIFLG